MIRSMTGFGDAAAAHNDIQYTVEVRSLNNRYYKLTCRLPDPLSSLESELEQALKKHVHRGSFTLTVKARVDSEAGAIVNELVLDGYLKPLEAIRKKLGTEGTTIELTSLLQLPGVLEQPEDEAAKAGRPILKKLLEEAVSKLNAMRVAEGEKLADDLRVHLNFLAERVALIAERRPLVLKDYETRLRTRVEELVSSAELTVDKVDLLREVAIYADRSDIAEELARTQGHIDQFETVLSRNDGEPDGRTLDFIAQELLREANTVASKSQDATIARAAVEMKSAIDRIKEQVQNVE